MKRPDGFLIAGEPIAEDGQLPRDQLERLARAGVTEYANGQWSFKGPGFVTNSDGLLAILPRPYADTQDAAALHRGAALTMATLLRYDQQPQRAVSSVEQPLVRGGTLCSEKVMSRLQTALELIVEAEEFGPFAVAEVRDGRDAGRILWNQTMAKYPPAGHPQNEVYVALVERRVRPNFHHPIAELHRRTLVAAHKLLRTGSSGVDDFRSAAHVLLVHGRTLFTDRGKRIVRLLRRFHESSGARDIGAIKHHGFLVAKSFHVVWEEMLRQVLGPVIPADLPRGRYALQMEPHESMDPPAGQKSGANLRTDLVIQDEDVLFILDAKDYGFGTYPHTADITKQILYRVLHTTVFDTRCKFRLADTFSAFLFPGNGVNTEGGGVSVRCYHTLQPDSAGWGDILGLDVDFARVAAAYASGRTDSGLRSEVLRLIRLGCGSTPSEGRSQRQLA